MKLDSVDVVRAGLDPRLTKRLRHCIGTYLTRVILQASAGAAAPAVKAGGAELDEQSQNKSGTAEAESASEGLLPDSEAFGDGDVVDMDSPKNERRTEAPIAPIAPGKQGQKRFRKRSVNITTLPDDQIAMVEETFKAVDKTGSGSISREDVAQVLKENYCPTGAEIAEVMQWMDATGDGHVTFNEYSVAMASVLTKTGLGAEDSIETARAALSAEMQKLSAAKTAEEDKVGKMGATEENVKNAHVLIGEEKLGHMKVRFETLDTEKKGFLTQEQVP